MILAQVKINIPWIFVMWHTSSLEETRDDVKDLTSKWTLASDLLSKVRKRLHLSQHIRSSSDEYVCYMVIYNKLAFEGKYLKDSHFIDKFYICNIFLKLQSSSSAVRDVLYWGVARGGLWLEPPVRSSAPLKPPNKMTCTGDYGELPS